MMKFFSTFLIVGIFALTLLPQAMLPQKQKRAEFVAILGVVIGVLLGVPTFTASAASIPDYPCELSSVLVG